jgi:hypothetical protein
VSLSLHPPGVRLWLTGYKWDLYLANTYSLEQLRELDLDRVRLPLEWFPEWLAQLPGDK